MHCVQMGRVRCPGMADQIASSDNQCELCACGISYTLYILHQHTIRYDREFNVISHQFIIQQQNSTNTVTNINTNEVETGMTRLIALTVTPVY